MTTYDRLRQIHTILEVVDARCIAGNVVLKASDLITDDELRQIRLLAKVEDHKYRWSIFEEMPQRIAAELFTHPNTWIAKVCNVNVITVRHWRKKLGIPPATGRGGAAREGREEFEQWWEGMKLCPTVHGNCSVD